LDAIDPDSVDDLSRDEILSLVRQLLLARSANRARSPREPSINPEAVATSVRASLDDHEWEPSDQRMSREVSVHKDRARKELKEKHWEDALLGATGVIVGFAEGYDTDSDREGDVAYELHETIEIADAALKCVRAKGVRKAAFDALMGLWWADRKLGGVGLSDDVPDVLRKRASKGEKARLAAWVKERLPEARDGYGREAAAQMYLSLAGSRLSSETYLEFCRENGLHIERVERLLRLRRAEEAARAACDVPHYRLTEAADLLMKAGYPALAVDAVHDRLDNPDAKGFRDRFKQWLQGHAERTGDLPEARRLAWDLFREQPTLQTYLPLRKVARLSKSWSTDEKEMLGILQRPGLGEVLTRVHLEEGRVAEALEALKAMPPSYPRDWSRDGLKRSVAQAAQTDFPGAARDLYLELANELIARKMRGFYAQAAPLVKLACALDERVLDGRGKTHILLEMRGRYGGLPALWDELQKAGVEVG